MSTELGYTNSLIDSYDQTTNTYYELPALAVNQKVNFGLCTVSPVLRELCENAQRVHECAHARDTVGE